MGPIQLRLISAFKLAQTKALDTGEEMSHEDIVFEALVEAMATLKRLPDPESGWLYANGFWPQTVADREDELENYKEMLRRVASGEESPDALMGKRPPSSAAIERMSAIFEVFPQCLIGKARSRDWKILCFLANGLSTRQVAALTHSGKGTVTDRRDIQTRRISAQLVELMPAPLGMVSKPPRMAAVCDRF